MVSLPNAMLLAMMMEMANGQIHAEAGPEMVPTWNLFAAFEPSTLAPATNATVSTGPTFSNDEDTSTPPAASKSCNLFAAFAETRTATAVRVSDPESWLSSVEE